MCFVISFTMLLYLLHIVCWNNNCIILFTSQTLCNLGQHDAGNIVKILCWAWVCPIFIPEQSVTGDSRGAPKDQIRTSILSTASSWQMVWRGMEHGKPNPSYLAADHTDGPDWGSWTHRQLGVMMHRTLPINRMYCSTHASQADAPDRRWRRPADQSHAKLEAWAKSAKSNNWWVKSWNQTRESNRHVLLRQMVCDQNPFYKQTH